MSLPSTGEISLSQINSVTYRSNTSCLIDKLSSSARSKCRAAFSTRLLRSNYFGPMVRVRRSTDSAEADFYANEYGHIGTSRYGRGTSLTSWLNGGTGFVRVWYDQSGCGAHVTQSTAANQPTITIASGTSGTTITYDGSSDFLTGSSSYTYPPALLTSLSSTLTNTGYADGVYNLNQSSQLTSSWYAFDRDSNTFWHTALTYNHSTGVYTGGVTTTLSTGTTYNGEWIQLSCPNPIRLTSYSILPRSGFAITRSPRSFVLIGSNNESSWDLVDSQTGITNWAESTTQTFSVATPGNYSCYRLVTTIVGNNTGSNQNSLQIAALQFIVNGIPIPAGKNTYSYMVNWMTPITNNNCVIVEQWSGGTNDRGAMLRLGNKYGHNGAFNDVHALVDVRTNVTTKSVMVVNNMLSTNNVKIYHNGVVYHGTSTNPATLSIGNTTFNMGGRYDGMELHTGTINEVLVFETALRDSDAMLYYTPTIGSVRPSGPFPKPRTWLNFHPMDANTFHTMHGYRAIADLDLAFLQGLSQSAPVSSWNGFTGYNQLQNYSSYNGPVYDTGYVSFTRTSNQYFDGGSKTLNISTNGGFSAVTIVQFNGTPGNWERIFDFGIGQDNSNILLARNSTGTTLTFAGRNSNVIVAQTDVSGVIVQGTWMAVAVRYNTSTKLCELIVNGVVYSTTGTTALTNRTITASYVGRPMWSADAYFQGAMTGLYIYDRLLSYEEIAAVTNFLRYPTLTQLPQYLTEYSNVRTSGPILYERYRYNYAARFNGLATTYIDIIDVPASPLSVCFWFYAQSSATFSEIFSLTDLNRTISGVSVQRDTSGNLFWVVHDGSTYRQANGPASSNGTWYHVVITMSTTQTQFYLNGSFNATLSYTTPSNTRIIIGASGQGDSSYGFNGYISDFRVYDYILRSSNITQIYDYADNSTFAPQIHATNPENYLVTMRNWYNKLVLDQTGSYTPVQSRSDPNVIIQLSSLSVSHTKNIYYFNARIQDYQTFTCSFEMFSNSSTADAFWFFCGSSALPSSEVDPQGGFLGVMQIFSTGTIPLGVALINNSGTTVVQNNYIHWRGQGAWTPVTITYTRGVINTWAVSVNGIDLITYSNSNNDSWLGTSGSLWGFCSRTGGSNMNLYIRRVEMSYTPYTGSISNISLGVVTPLRNYPEAAMTANSSGNIVASSSGIYQNDTAYSPFKAFDTDTSTMWGSPVNYNTTTGVYTGAQSTTVSGTSYSGEWLQVQLPSAITIRSYTLTVRSTSETPRNPPTTWILGGSNDGSNWTLIDSQTTMSNWGANKTVFTTNSNTAYKYFRIVIRVVGTSSDRSYCVIKEFDLYGIPRSQTQTSFSALRFLTPSAQSFINLSLEGYSAGAIHNVIPGCQVYDTSGNTSNAYLTTGSYRSTKYIAVGAGQGRYTTVTFKQNASFLNIPTFTNNDVIVVEWSTSAGTLGHSFRFGYDQDNNGLVNLSSTTEEGPGCGFVSQAGTITAYAADSTSINTVFWYTQSAGWVRVRQVYDLKRATQSVFIRFENDNRYNFTPIPQFTNLPLNLNWSSSTVTNPTNWNAIQLYSSSDSLTTEGMTITTYNAKYWNPNLEIVGAQGNVPCLIDGLTWKFYDGDFNSDMITKFETSTYTYIGRTTNTANTNSGTNGNFIVDGQTNYAVEWVGYFKPTVSGTWTFYTESDDGSYLWLGNLALAGYTTSNALVSNGGIHGVVSASGTITLVAGVYYPIRARYSQGMYGSDCRISFQAPDGTRTYDGSGLFFSSTGTNPSYPAESAKVIKDITNTTTDGMYYINSKGFSTPVYCLMNDCYAGGGWMMLMKATRGNTFQYSANYWSTSNVLNPTQTNRLDGDAKFAVFNNNYIKDVMAIFPDVPSLSYTNVYGRNGGSLNLDDGWCWKVENWNGSSRTTALSGFQNSRQATPSDPNLFNGYSTSVFSRQTIAARHIFGGGSILSANQYARWGMIFNDSTVNDFSSVDNFCGIGVSSVNYSAGDVYNCCGTAGLNRTMRVELYGR